MTTAAVLTELPKYKSHKTVQAFKIQSVKRLENGAGSLIDSAGMQTLVTQEFMQKHDPQEGGYYVLYQDGYHSYSPAEPFEDGYTLITTPTRKVKVLTSELQEQIAITCHETNRIYCGTIGDNSQPWWTDAPDWQKQSARNGVSHHWTALERGEEPTPEQSHNSWLKEKREAGWTYGEKKDPEAKTHPCFKPYADLPLEQRMKDHLFINIVKAFFFAN